jgi:dCTP deaminase
MILTGPEITSATQRGDVILVPFDEASVNPNSYNYHLGEELVVFEPGLISPSVNLGKRIKIPPEGYILYPGHLYLGSTFERIGSPTYAVSLIGRSTLGRLGLWLQITADLGHVGCNHYWTLEMKVVQPLRVFSGMPIGQVSFWVCQGKIPAYHGRYQGDTKPMPSKVRKELS